MNNTSDTQQLSLKVITNSKWFWALISLLAAFILWTFVTTTEGVEVTETFSNVPIEFLGADALRESSGLVVTEQDQTSVNLTLSATRRVLNRLSSDNITASINLRNMSTDGRYSVTYDISYPTEVNPADVTVVRSNFSVVNFYLDKMSRKTVDVEGSFTGTTAEGYMIQENMTFDPLVVTISGPKTLLSQVDSAFVSISRQDVNKSLQFSTTYDLLDVNGNVVDDSSIIRETEEVTVTMNVLSTRTVPLDVTVIDGGGATRQDNTEITIQPSSVVLAGDAETIDNTAKLILGTVDLSTFSGNFVASYTIIPPDNTEIISGGSEASVTVSIKGLATKGFIIPSENITCVNVPEGYSAQILTEQLSDVIIRAPENVIAAISAASLRAVADLADINAASGNVFNPVVRITVEGYPSAGVLGEHRIYVTLNVAEEPEEG